MPQAATLQPRDRAAPKTRRRRAHLVGVAGAGMRSLAALLHASGWQVSGSDDGSSLTAPFPTSRGRDARTIDAALQLVVHSTAVPRGHAELRQARQLGIPVKSYPEMLGRLMRCSQGVAIAGTHGKSTATAMAGEILVAAGLDPTLVVGAQPIGRPSGARCGRGSWTVVEACEYRAAFLHLRPRLAAILNIEPDHFDCFATQHELEDAFARFALSVPPDGLVLRSAECARTRQVCSGVRCHSETFGLTSAATWLAAGLHHRGGYYAFELRRHGRALCRVRLRVPGRHNVRNALAAAALASHCGASDTAIQAGLEQFAGLRRRLQPLGESGGVAIVDDYAHHPTEVAAALSSVREMYPGRPVCCVFQPHQASRLSRLLDEFAGSLQNAERVIVADVFRVRERRSGGAEVTANDLCARVAQSGRDVVHLASAREIRDHLRQSLRPGDVLLTMGAGDIGRVADELRQGF